MTKPLNVGMIGYGFMGKAHSNAYAKVNHFFDLQYRPVLKAVCARSADKAWLEEQARNRAALAAVADAERTRLDALLLDELRLAGDYPDRLRRAEARSRLLAETPGTPPAGLLHRLARTLGDVEPGAGPAAVAAALDFASVDDLQRALLAEHLHPRATA